MNISPAPSILSDAQFSNISTGHITANNKTIINVAEPVYDSDAATKAYVDNNIPDLDTLKTLTISNTSGMTLTVESLENVNDFVDQAAVLIKGGTIIQKNLFLGSNLIFDTFSGRIGSSVLINGSCQVFTNAITNNSVIFLTPQTISGTAGSVYVSDKIPGESFKIFSTSDSDESLIGWAIIDSGHTICFHGSTKVILESGDIIPIKDLKNGDSVYTRLENGLYGFSKVLTFTGYFPKEKGKSIQLQYYNDSFNDTDYINVSYEHLLFVRQCRYNHLSINLFKFIPASEIVPGDELMSYNNIPVKVANVIPNDIELTGWYSPLTESGTIMVSNIVASCHTKDDHYAVSAFYYPLKLFYKLWPLNPRDPIKGSHLYSLYFRRSIIGKVIIKFLSWIL